MDRRTARTHAMKLIYEWEMGGEGGEDTRLGLLDLQPDEQDTEYMDRMFEGVVAHVDEIDQKIAEFSRGWSLERIVRVDLAILRMATYELMLGEVPAGVVINEAVELANEFSTDKASTFINGVLGSISRSVER